MLRVLDSAGPAGGLRSAPSAVWPSPQDDAVGVPDYVISELDGWPALPPVNASPHALRHATHDSGP